MVEPDRATVAEYNRWYERDHFLAGMLTGPGVFAGRRFLATRALKDRRLPDPSPVARPLDDGSFVAVYWIERDQFDAHCAWGFPEAARLAALGRMDTRRHHVSTSYYDVVGTARRPDHEVPVELALHHPYAGLLLVWTAPAEGVDTTSHDAWTTDELAPTLLDAGAAQIVSMRPRDLPPGFGAMPGVAAGAEAPPGTTLHGAFLTTEPASAWDDGLGATCHRLAHGPAGRVLLAAPFLPSVMGTSEHLDALW